MEQSVGFIAGLHFFITMGHCKTEYGKTRRNMFCPFRLRVSVLTCNSLNSCLLSTDTPAAGVSVINLPTHRHPTLGVSVVNTHVYCKLYSTTDTYSLKGGTFLFRQRHWSPYGSSRLAKTRVHLALQ